MGIGDDIVGGVGDVFSPIGQLWDKLSGKEKSPVARGKAAASEVTAPNNYYLGNQRDYGRLRGEGFWQAGTEAGNRLAPQIDRSGYNPYLGAGNMQLGGSNAALMRGAQQMQGSDIAGLGQLGMANYMQNVAMGTAGPSAAELAMQRQSAANAQQQMMMAAAAGGGPGAVAAQIAAQNQNARAQGQLVQDLGVQRAQEQIAARETLRGLYSDARSGYQGGAGAYGALAGQSTDVAGMYGQYGGLEADIAKAQLDANLQAQAQNDAREMGLHGLGFQYLQAGQQGTAAYNDALIRAGIGYGGVAGGSEQSGNQLLGAGASAAGGLIASDIRAKENIQPASGDLNQTFRNFQPYSWNYKNPAQYGGGRFYGGMAQDLEATPAGATAVQQGPGGAKMIDTSRLATLTAAETANLRRELDEVQRTQPAEIRGDTTSLVRDQADRLRAENDRDAGLLESLRREQDQQVTALARPTTYPTPTQPTFGQPPRGRYGY